MRAARVISGAQERPICRDSLTIQDDGNGFDPNRARGLGLVGMNERVTQLGGVFRVDSSPGHGTCLHVDLPLRNVPANRDRVDT